MASACGQQGILLVIWPRCELPNRAILNMSTIVRLVCSPNFSWRTWFTTNRTRPLGFCLIDKKMQTHLIPNYDPKIVFSSIRFGRGWHSENHQTHDPFPELSWIWSWVKIVFKYLYCIQVWGEGILFKLFEDLLFKNRYILSLYTSSPKATKVLVLCKCTILSNLNPFIMQFHQS